MSEKTKPAKREIKTPYAFRVVTKIGMPKWLTPRARADVLAGVFELALVTAVRLGKSEGSEVLEVELLAPAEDERMASISEATRKIFERVQSLLREAESRLPKKT